MEFMQMMRALPGKVAEIAERLDPLYPGRVHVNGSGLRLVRPNGTAFSVSFVLFDAAVSTLELVETGEDIWEWELDHDGPQPVIAGPDATIAEIVEAITAA